MKCIVNHYAMSLKSAKMAVIFIIPDKLKLF